MSAYSKPDASRDLLLLSARELAALVRAREVSAVEVVTVYLERAASVQHLNAVVSFRDAAIAEAGKLDRRLAGGGTQRLPLAGVPITVKDSIDVAGVRSTGGTKGAESRVPLRDATVVRRLRAAGAIVLGKTNMAELGLAYETDNRVFGRTVNPFDARLTPGGSSGGEAAILAAGGSALGIGSDSGGSVRVPAAYCGLQALKPTRGVVPTAGHFPPAVGKARLLLQIGPMARFVGDLELVLDVVGPRMEGDRQRSRHSTTVDEGKGPLRIAWTRGIETGEVDPAVSASLEGTVQNLQHEGHLLEQIEVPEAAAALDVQRRLLGGGELPLRRLLAAVGTPWEQRHSFVDRLAGKMESGSQDIDALPQFVAGFEARLRGYDAVVCPATTTVAPPHGVTFDDRHWPGFGWVVLFNLTGWPAVVVRAGTDPRGLPVAIQIAAARHSDRRVLELARRIEALTPRWMPAEQYAAG